MYIKNNSVGLPAGLIKTLDTGCPGYEPLEKVPFSPQIDHLFNPSLAAWSINACTYAYQDLCHKNDIIFPPEVENAKLLYWNETVGIFRKPELSSGYIARIKPIAGDPTNRVAIIFRGTQTHAEWNLDADVRQEKIILEPSGDLVKIHKGFWEILQNPAQKGFPSLQDQINKTLPTLLSSDAPNEIHIGGHSMGAAIALLVTLDSILRYPNVVVNSYLTGCPRVGDPAFANAFNDFAKNPNYNFSIWRIANTEDIITTLPEPMAKGTLYSHVLISNPDDPNVIDLISFTKNLGRIFDNHHLFNYYYAMKKLISENTKESYERS